MTRSNRCYRFKLNGRPISLPITARSRSFFDRFHGPGSYYRLLHYLIETGQPYRSISSLFGITFQAISYHYIRSVARKIPGFSRQKRDKFVEAEKPATVRLFLREVNRARLKVKRVYRRISAHRLVALTKTFEINGQICHFRSYRPNHDNIGYVQSVIGREAMANAAFFIFLIISPKSQKWFVIPTQAIAQVAPGKTDKISIYLPMKPRSYNTGTKPTINWRAYENAWPLIKPHRRGLFFYPDTSSTIQTAIMISTKPIASRMYLRFL